MLFALALACVSSGATDDAVTIAPRTEMSVSSVDGLPQRAPGVVLLATLAADNSMTVGGTVQAELWVDLDQAGDSRYPFRYAVRDAAGQTLYQRTTSGPLIVREFLAYYGDLTGYQLLELFPLLGTFTVIVPLLENGATVEFQLRDDRGDYCTVGDYALADVVVDDIGVSAAVTGVEALHEGGDPDNALDIVIVPDGYQELELDNFVADAALVAGSLLDTSPLAEYRDTVNIHRVDVPSVESGASYDCEGNCEMRDTAFDSFFPLELVNRAIGSNYRTTAVFQLDQWEVARAASVVPWDIVLVIVNSEHDGGFAVHYSTVTNGMSNLGNIAGHELFHVLGQLGDEYNADDCIRSDALGLPANITDNPESPPWSHWIDDDTPLPTPDDNEYDEVVGAFESAYNCNDLYRPQQSCMMRGSSSTPDLCAVCAELVTRRIFRYADAALDATVTEDTPGQYRFELTGVREDASVEWTLDDDVVGRDDVLVLGLDDVPNGNHTVTGRATVESEFVLDDEGDLGTGWEWQVE